MRLHDGLEHGLLPDGAEDHGDAIGALFGQILHDFAEKRIRNLNQQAGTVARLRVVARRAAVHEALENGETAFDDPARGDVVQACDESHAAGVMFKFRVVHSPLSISIHFLDPFGDEF